LYSPGKSPRRGAPPARPIGDRSTTYPDPRPCFSCTGADKLDAIKLGTATRITNRSIKALIAGAPRLTLRRHKRTAQAT
jgi:hypothetical protein